MSLAAEVLLQRTRAEQVTPVFERFRELYPTPQELAEESEERLLRTTGSLGLRWRAPLMIRMAQAVADRGRPPDRYEQLIELPGVGPYAASAYLSFHRAKRATIADSNIVRWAGRVFGISTDAETRRKKWLLTLLNDLTPQRNSRSFNYSLLDLSMTVCSPRPKCSVCPLAKGVCRYARASAASS